MSTDNENVHKNHEICKETETEEDIRLKNWHAWLEEWEKARFKISEKINIKPEKLLMNYGEGLRSVNEEKLLLQYAKITTKFDKYRGTPDFWKLPVSLPQKFKFCIHEPRYFAVKSKEDMYVIPPFEYVGIPEYIQYEMNVLRGTRLMYTRWKNSEFRQDQMEKFSSKINAIVPHRPHFRDLIVLGTKITDSETDKATVEQIDISEVNKDEPETDLPKTTQPRLNLKIDGIILDPNCQETGSRKLRLYFEYDISSCTISLDYVNFENLGSTTLRISWNKLNKFRLFRNYVDEKWTKHGFYFNKSELLLLPGQKIEFPIWFETEIGGSYSESWEFKTEPKIWSDNLHVILVLQSYAYFGDMKEKVDAIIKYIDIQARNILIKDILRDIVDQVKYQETVVEPCIFEEAHLFQMANLVNGRPEFLFDDSIVEELKTTYNKIKTEAKNWNYAIKLLQKLAHKMDVSIYLENKVLELEDRISKMQKSLTEQINLKEKSLSKTKTKKSKDKIKTKKIKGKIKGKKSKDKTKSTKSKDKTKSTKSKDKTKSSRSKDKIKSTKKSKGKGSAKADSKSDHNLEEAADSNKEKYIFTNQLELWNVVKQLDSPVVLHTEREKYFFCSKIMSAYFKRMTHLLDLLETEKNVQKSSRYPQIKYRIIPINEQPERLVYEYFEDHYIPRNIFTNGYPFEAKRKPKILRDIPSYDVETVYATYFGTSLISNKETSKTKKLSKRRPKSTKNKKEKSTKKGKDKSTKKGKDKSTKKGKDKSSKKTDKTKNKKGKTLSKSLNKSKEKIDVKKDVSLESFDPYSEQFNCISEPEETGISNANKTLKPSKQKEEMDDYKYEEYIIVYSCLNDAVNAIVDTIHSFDCVVSYKTLNEIQTHCPENE